jgi:glycine/D-amino acid oxidase-like deaminating enzyme
MASEGLSYIIVGAGVFGVSTAYHLIQRYPHASVTIVDRDAYDAESRVAASWDWNKVVRADYDDIVYCQLALEAQDIFKSDPLWKPYFHETGIYWMCRSDYAQDVINNYKKLGRTADLEAVPVEKARKLYGGLFEDADYTGVKEVLVNKTSGWAAAGDALRAVTKKALELGVKYHVGEVGSLQFDLDGRCSGIKTTRGEVLSASHTILCTGAYTPKLLEYSAQSSGIKEISAGNRIVAGGITTGMTKLDDESYKRFAKMPVGVQGYTAQAGKISIYSMILKE